MGIADEIKKLAYVNENINDILTNERVELILALLSKTVDYQNETYETICEGLAKVFNH